MVGSSKDLTKSFILPKDMKAVPEVKVKKANEDEDMFSEKSEAIPPWVSAPNLEDEISSPDMDEDENAMIQSIHIEQTPMPDNLQMLNVEKNWYDVESKMSSVGGPLITQGDMESTSQINEI